MKKRRNLWRCKAQVESPEFGQFLANAQASKPPRRIHARGDNNVQSAPGGRQMIQQKRHVAMDLRFGDNMQIVQNENDLATDLDNVIDQ